MNEKQILEDYLRNLKNFGCNTKKYQEKYKEIIKIKNHEKEFIDLIEEIREEMTKKYHKRIGEAISRYGDKYDELKSLMV